MATTEDTRDGFTIRGALANASFTGFTILGGKYQFVASDTGTTHCTLYMLAPDNATDVVVSDLTSPGMDDALDLIAGTYAVVFGAVGTLGYCSLQRVPYAVGH